MKKIFVTGATGFIGNELLKALLEQGFSVNALYRIQKKSGLRNKNLQYFQGDILNLKVLYEGMKECAVVFHLAAHTRVWDKNPETYYNVNVKGTRNVLETALNLDIKKVMITSTAGVFGPSNHLSVTENKPLPDSYFTYYEKTKYLAEKVIDTYIRKGLNIIRLYPTRVYGPGLISDSNSVTKLIFKYVQGKWHLLPGNGKRTGNYVFIEDIVKGHLSALERNIQNEKFILGGIDMNYKHFFDTISKISHRKNWLVPVPVPFMLLVASILKAFAEIFGRPPLITPGWVKKYMVDWNTSSAKAQEILGYKITPFETGIEKTIKWLEQETYPIK